MNCYITFINPSKYFTGGYIYLWVSGDMPGHGYPILDKHTLIYHFFLLVEKLLNAEIKII